MRILFLTRLLPQPFGIAGSIIIYNRIRYLIEKGHEVGVLTFIAPDEKPFLADVRLPLMDLVALPAPPAVPPVRQILDFLLSVVPPPFKAWQSRPMALKLGEMIERCHYDVVVAEYTAMGQYVYRNPYLPAVRRVVSCHECCTTAFIKAIRLNPWSLHGLARWALLDRVRRYEFDMYRNMDHVIVLTPQERFGLLKFAPNLRISVVPHGVDLAYYASVPVLPRDDAILFVGFFSNESNRDAVHWFVKTVWPTLKRDYPSLKFYLVGRGVTADIRDLGRRDSRIIVTGQVEDIRPYFAKAKVFVCPIRMGSGFRAKVVEAMASGVPVVATSLAVEGIPAWGGETLLLGDTPRQLIDRIRLLLTDATLGKMIAQNAREMVVSRFDRESGMTSLDTMLDGVMAGYD